MSEQRTEEATPRKLREARRRGDVWRSPEVSSALVLLGAATVLGASGSALLEAHASAFTLALDAAAGRTAAGPGAVLEASLAIAARALAPLMIAVVVLGALGAFVQVGPLVAPGAIAWRLGAQSLVSAKRLVALLKAVVIALAIGAIAITTIADATHGTLGLIGRDALSTLHTAGTLVRTILLRTGGVLLAIAAADVVYRRWRWLRDQRMSKRELAREHRDDEGDPHLKQARERLRREIAQHDALESARRADVLVVSATVAIALRFIEESEQAAPVVIAKGQGELAGRMIATAREARIAISHDEPLAAALGELETGDEIPARLYEPVAAVLRAAWADEQLPPPAGRRTPAA